MTDQQNGMVVYPNGRSGGAQVARHGFGEQSMERKTTAATAMAERARSEVQARYIVALQRPRNVDEFRVRLLEHCKRPRFAASARYAKPVGGQTIEGASVRFVETALCEYGNVLPESSIVFEDEEQIVVRVSVTDLERNITHAAEAAIAKRMERRHLRKGQTAIAQRTNSYGDLVYTVVATEDDVANMKASRESKLLRNLGLRILPADIVDEAMSRCITSLRDGAAKDPAAARKQIADAFFAVGVSPAMLATYLGHPLEATTPAELVALREHYQALKDGETTWADITGASAEAAASDAQPTAEATPPTAPTKGVAGAKAQLAARAKKASPPPGVPAAATPSAPEKKWTSKDVPPDLALEVDDIALSLETVFQHPEWVIGLRARIAALPDEHPRKDGLVRALEDAESEIAMAAREEGE